MERNNGQLFKVEYDRAGMYGKDDQKSGGYYTDEDFKYGAESKERGAAERPIFKIKFKPRSRCHVHQEVSIKLSQQHKEKL